MADDLTTVLEWARKHGPADIENAACRMLDAPSDELCGDECPQLFGEQEVSCTRPKGHAVHRNPKRGTGWEKLCDNGYRRVEQAEATIERVKAVRDGWYRRPYMSDQADELDVALDGPEDHGDGRTPQTLGAGEGQATTEAHGGAQ